MKAFVHGLYKRKQEISNGDFVQLDLPNEHGALRTALVLSAVKDVAVVLPVYTSTERPSKWISMPSVRWSKDKLSVSPDAIRCVSVEHLKTSDGSYHVLGQLRNGAMLDIQRGVLHTLGLDDFVKELASAPTARTVPERHTNVTLER